MSLFSKTVLTLSTALALSTSALAFHGNSCKHGKTHNMTQEQRKAHMEKRLQKMAKKLDLTETQVAQIKTIKAQNKTQKKSIHEQVKQLRATLKQQHQNKAAEANIEATHDQL